MVESLTSSFSHWTWCSLRQAPFCFIYFFFTFWCSISQSMYSLIFRYHESVILLSRCHKVSRFKTKPKIPPGLTEPPPSSQCPQLWTSVAMLRTGEPTFLRVLPLLFHIPSSPAPLPSPFSFLSFFKSVYVSLNLICEMLTHFCCSCYGLHGIINCLGLIVLVCPRWKS